MVHLYAKPSITQSHRISNEIHLPPVPPKRISCVSDPHDPYTNHNRSGDPFGDSSSTSASASYTTHMAAGGEPTLKTFSPNNWIPQQPNEFASTGRPLPPTPKSSRRPHPPTTLSYANEHDHGYKPRLSHSSLGGRSADSGVGVGAVSGGVGGDAMTAIIADSTPTTTGSASASTSSSSGEDATTPTLPASGSACTTRQMVSASIDIEPYQVLPYDVKKMNPNPPSSATTNGGSSATATKSGSNGDIAVVADVGGCDSDAVIVGRVTMKEMSPMVFTDTITTGGYRYTEMGCIFFGYELP